MSSDHILIIYPEVHNTKIAVYRNVEPLFLKTINHTKEELAQFSEVADQKDFRIKFIRKELENNNYPLESIEVFMGRGGLVKPVSQGVYRVNDALVKDLEDGIVGKHATNLGALIAYALAQNTNKEAYIANPVVVDELSDVARITGHPLFERRSVFHALNHKHVAKKYAKSMNKKYEDLNLIICHIGTGGVSIGAHKNGMVVDVNQAYDGGGPFGITRSGTLPMGQLVHMCFSGKYTEDEIMDMITEDGGYKAYLGTDDINEINKMLAEGDKKAQLISYALSYQVSKEIASHIATLGGRVDAIILTGVIFDSSRFLENVKRRIGSIAPIALYPVVNDIGALAMYGYEILKGEVAIKEYV